MYTDESYIHHHHRSIDENLYFPSHNYVEKVQHKGERICFVAAIKYKHGQSIGGLVSGSVWSFCPTQKRDHKGDYHKVFNAENYINWFETQLLPNLHEAPIIIMGNARYHKTKPIDTPNPSKWRKIQVLELFNNYSVDYDKNITAIEAM